MPDDLNPKEEEFTKELFEWVSDTLGIDPHKPFAGDDWTLIVKLHALIETALNMSVVKHLSAPELVRIVAKLETSNMATGKVAFAKALNIIPKDTATFIQKLSELRNFCVHDIRNFDFTLKAYVDKLDDNERKAFLKLLLSQTNPEFQGTDASVQVSLIAGAWNVMMHLFVHHWRCKVRDTATQLQRVRAKLYAEQTLPNPKEE